RTIESIVERKRKPMQRTLVIFEERQVIEVIG
ncbi:MAG: hypothetical protein ACI92G_002261, partial [Candidatus Pelagisphaera sp.]